jgi:hypothetical protein
MLLIALMISASLSLEKTPSTAKRIGATLIQNKNNAGTQKTQPVNANTNHQMIAQHPFAH